MLEPLQPLQRSVLRLTVLEGVSMRKAAERLGVAPATVQRARPQGLGGVEDGPEGSEPPERLGAVGGLQLPSARAKGS